MIKYIVRDISNILNIGGIFMKKNSKNKKILIKIWKDLNFCDRIIMKIFKNYSIRVYRIGLRDGFCWTNKKLH